MPRLTILVGVIFPLTSSFSPLFGQGLDRLVIGTRHGSWAAIHSTSGLRGSNSSDEMALSAVPKSLESDAVDEVLTVNYQSPIANLTSSGDDGTELAVAQERKGRYASLDGSEPFLSKVRDWLAKLKDSVFLGIEPTPEIIAIMTIYFVEGALGLARLAQTFLLKDELHLGPAELSALTGVFALPWTIKPLYGFLSDGVPLFGYRRRSYLILCGILGCISYFALGTDFGGLVANEWSLPATVASLLLSSACVAFSDVVADGIVVQQTRDSQDPSVAGGLQSLCWGSSAAGGLLSAYFSGSLLEIMTPRHVFALTAILPFLVTLIATSINESPVSNDDDGGVLQQVQDLWSAIKQPSIWKPALFIFLWQSTPTSDGAFLYFMTNDLGFGPEFLGRARLLSSASSLIGVWVFQKFLRSVAIKDILFWSALISTPLGLTSLLLISHANRALGIPDGAFVLGDDVILSILGEVAFLPTLVLAARLCPPGVEAVLFATLMSIFNGASTVGTEIGAVLTKWLGITESNFDNLSLLTILCNVSSLYPLLFIGWLDEVESSAKDEMTMKE
jgi:folate/biopterin transporter